MTNLLENPGFEGSWWRKTHTGQEFGELFVPLRWVAYWREGGPVPHDPHNQSGYGRPEMHVINREAPFLDPIRVRSGERALKFFTFYRIHDAGVYQQVTGVEPGTCLRGTGWGHAWSSTKDDPRTSEGVGRQAFSIRSSDYQAGAMDEAVRNVTLALGIDPTGGNDPWSERVVWGEGAHIYNAYAQIPSVEVEAEADRVTFFVRSTVLWPFKHCDVYLDDMRLTALREERASVDIALSPERIRAGEPFEVTVSGGRGPTGLTVAIEDSRVYQQSPYIAGESLKGRYVATEPGTYEVQVWAAQTPVAAQTPMASRTFR
ncbi:MAG: PPC domain-containing protein, partial [Anaerolineae bacterium]